VNDVKGIIGNLDKFMMHGMTVNSNFELLRLQIPEFFVVFQLTLRGDYRGAGEAGPISSG